MTASDSRGPDPHPHGLDAEVQRELAEAMGDENPEELMEQSVAPTKAPPPSGEDAGPADPEEPLHLEMRRGRIAAIRGEDVFVDLAGETGKLQGVVPLAQFDRPPRLGSIMDFVIDHVDEAQGLMFLSREGAISRSTWDQLHKGLAVEARVVATNKGGLEMEMVGGIRAFMPASQVDLHHVDDLEALVGQKLEGLVQEIDRKSKKVVLSRRHLLEQRRAAAKEKLLAELKAGQVREGVVSNIVAFGAFVDLGGIDGLLHVSDMSYGHVDKPGDVVKKGQTLQVMVLKVEDGGNRISLGLKQTEPDPWEGFLAQARVGSQVEGRVTRTANFGAFVEVAPGVEGLLPISEMSWKRVHNAEEVVKAGDHIRLSIISLDPEKRRMSLSLKQAEGDPWMGVERRFEKGATVPGTVRSTTEFGAFVELAPGVDGLVHISELADRRVGTVEEVVKPGDVKDFRILEVNEEQRKISLSLRKPREAGEPRTDHGKPHAPPPRAAPRKPRTDLKGGMDAQGIGLGKLRLEDLQ